ELELLVEDHLVQLDRELLALRVRRDDRAVALDDRARGRHPVERLVRLGVGVDGNGTVGLEDEEAARPGEAGAEPPVVHDRALRHDETHRRVVARRIAAPPDGACHTMRPTATEGEPCSPKSLTPRTTSRWCCTSCAPSSGSAPSSSTGSMRSRCAPR